jgi:hypothetical protein
LSGEKEKETEMSNPMVPPGTAPLNPRGASEEAGVPVKEDDVDKGGTNDDQDTVERDIREAAKSSERLSE